MGTTETIASWSYEARTTWNRLVPPLREGAGKDSAWPDFERRLETSWPRLFGQLTDLYAGHFDYYWQLERTLEDLWEHAQTRPDRLRQADHERELDPDWFTRPEWVGGALYVDLFSENLGKLREHIPYFKRLGLTYLHLMPLFAVRPGENDGGYAVSNYRSVNPDIGTVDDLRALADELAEAGILLVLDFVFNHTADDHPWANQAIQGDEEHRRYYHLFPDRSVPDQYERTLREIFPTVRRGNFTWDDRAGAWVWTTFNSYQWDLDYRNPAVFRAMLNELLFIANLGVDVVRLDAVAFIWKKMGTSCENLDEAHELIRAFRAAVDVAAPGVVFKSEAIVHPDEVVRYIDQHECALSYNPLLMALLWESLATRDVKLLARSLARRNGLPEHTAWCNYLRCHDDIGWTFDDDDARALGIDPHGHRKFLNQFYTGQFKGSFARGVPFQADPETGDMRISGTLASLAGLEQALEAGNAEWEEMAVRRIELLRAVLMALGGIPLIYLGEEWGELNDYDYVRDPAKIGDTRWIHRPKMKWEYLDELDHAESLRTRLFGSLQRLIDLRKSEPALTGNRTEVFAAGDPAVLGFVRRHEGHRLVVVANFSEHPVTLDGNVIRTAGLARKFADRMTGDVVDVTGSLDLAPYQSRWLQRQLD